MDPFIGQIMQFAGNFAPRGWALCDGQLLAISSNQALFSILGTTYGGDGRTTFALPDLRGRVALHPGTGPGLTGRHLGEKIGAESVTLNTTQLPSHNHGVACLATQGTVGTPSGNFLAGDRTGGDDVYSPTSNATMNAAMIENNGGGQGHANMQPSLGINFIIALVGTFPSRN